MRVAIMQPYFAPYVGYFRLLQATDLFLIFDTAQFQRRGWMHRNRFPNSSGHPQWLTLPLAKAPQATSIVEMRFATDAHDRWERQLASWPDHRLLRQDHDLAATVMKVDGSFSDYAVRLIDAVARRLDLRMPQIARTSSLGPDADRPGATGAARIASIARAVGATHYVNPPGGRDLYDHGAFANEGLELRYLSPFVGAAPWSILHRYLTEPPERLRTEIIKQSVLVR